MAVAARDVDNRGRVGHQAPVPEAAADQQVAGVDGEPHDHADVVGLRATAEPAAGGVVLVFLSLAEGLDARLAQIAGPALHHILFVRAAAAGSACRRVAGAAVLGACAATAAEEGAESSAATADPEHGCRVEGHAQPVVAVGDRALVVGDPGREDAAARPEVGRLADVHAVGQAEVDGELRCARHGDEHAAGFDKLLQVEHAFEAEAAPHVVGRGLAPDVGRDLGGLPRDRVVALQAAHVGHGIAPLLAHDDDVV